MPVRRILVVDDEENIGRSLRMILEREGYQVNAVRNAAEFRAFPERARVDLFQGSLLYRDNRLSGFDAAALVEVIEHLDAPRLAAFERVLFDAAHPKTIIVTTPNAEYNVKFDTLPAGQFRHKDHRFEWTREQFKRWADGIAERFGYSVEVKPVGEEDQKVGGPTQMGIFRL